MKIDSNTSEVRRSRLNAAAALVPIIESGLSNSKLTPERASLMSEFCFWATQADFGECEKNKATVKEILAGLDRVKALLP
jgi:hypothetical protein